MIIIMWRCAHPCTKIGLRYLSPSLSPLNFETESLPEPATQGQLHWQDKKCLPSTHMLGGWTWATLHRFYAWILGLQTQVHGLEQQALYPQNHHHSLALTLNVPVYSNCPLSYNLFSYVSKDMVTSALIFIWF